ncbi:chloride channel protein [Cohaesibacter celericrescens]|uniref:Chloride channel protein n=1 Tax=Cohaesibacter celericrescens TaxID=2067669 RepID=A0A2N5XWR0_9HYPH|nr:chloride channel protein [Cohaesibacter celericrescens]PLW75533.1 chloride channel protein [Cohaesibacter celericrescens]PLW78940.1 chloride channel protein [Cohaesibacter celericrescens]
MRWLNPLQLSKSWIEPNWRVYLSTQQPKLWFLAIVIGMLVSCAAIVFRLGIGAVQWLWLGTNSESILTAVQNTPAWVVILAPTIGGLVVGLFLEYVHPIKRAEAVADVIEARAHGGKGLRFWQGLDSAAVTIISLGAGASAGREGPIVHLGASLAKMLCEAFSLTPASKKTLLACGVASAVSASFNAPIAGVLFAHEVILGHYALTAFVPIVLASAMGTMLSRLYFGDIAAFDIPAYQITSYWEMPAFALLGLTCAFVAVLFQFTLMGTDWVARHVKMPLPLRPVIGGFLIGCIALYYPEILGVGYEATDKALHQQLPLAMLFGLIIAKTAATAITLASRFGGGIFSPSLYVGAMTGGTFGLIAAQVFPDMASSHGLYAILGMGAVAAAVLGAPVSTTMIVFELTGGYALSIALLLTVSIATGITLALHGRSYFHWQLEMRGIFLQEGAHKFLVKEVKVAQFYKPLPENAKEEQQLLPQGAPTIRLMDTLEKALKAFDAVGGEDIAVLDPEDKGRIIGWAQQVQALRYFNDKLISTNVEEHR